MSKKTYSNKAINPNCKQFTFVNNKLHYLTAMTCILTLTSYFQLDEIYI